jgi:hypothetical protein
MFLVKIFVEDNKLSKVMWALDGLVVGMPETVPVRGAKASPDKKKVVATVTKSGESIISKMINAVLAQPVGDSEITTKKLVEIGMKAGAKSRASAGSSIAHIIKAGHLKSIEKGRYQIIRT